MSGGNLAIRPSLEDGDFNGSGSYVGPRDALEDILGDIVDGRPARAKLDKLKRGEKVTPTKPAPRQATRRPKDSFDVAVAELLDDHRAETTPSRKAGRSSDQLLDVVVDRFFADEKAGGNGSLDEAAADLIAENGGQRAVARPSPDAEARAQERGRLAAEASAAIAGLHNEINLLLNFVASVAQKFPTVRSQSDLAILAANDPFGFMQFRSLQADGARMWQATEALYNDAMLRRQVAFDAFAAHEDELFRRRFPDWGEEDAQAVMVMMLMAGLDHNEISTLYRTPTSVNLGDQRALAIIGDAARRHAGKDVAGMEMSAAVVSAFHKAGFSADEVNALLAGSAISLRDHRLMTLCAWAMQWQRRG
jgi:hypothetical protein